MSVKKLSIVEVGKGSGLLGDSLMEWIGEQQEVERAERAAKREADKDERQERMREAERQKEEAERQEEEAERQERMREAERQERMMEAERQEREDRETERRRKEVESKRERLDREDRWGGYRPEIPVFVDGRDDVDSYLTRFERVADMFKWDKEEWAVCLSVLLTGRALDAYVGLSAEEAKDYDKLKRAILERYGLTEEGYRRKFRESIAEEDEDPKWFLERLKGYLNKWVERSGVERSVEGICELLVQEQFLATCEDGLAMFVREHPYGDLAEVGEVANRYLRARGRNMKGASRKGEIGRRDEGKEDRRMGMKCWRCGQLGHRKRECRAQGKVREGLRGYRVDRRRRCYRCGKAGHVAVRCSERRGETGGVVRRADKESAGAKVGEFVTRESALGHDGKAGVAIGENGREAEKGEVWKAGACLESETEGMLMYEGEVGGRRGWLIKDIGVESRIQERGRGISPCGRWGWAPEIRSRRQEDRSQEFGRGERREKRSRRFGWSWGDRDKGQAVERPWRNC